MLGQFDIDLEDLRAYAHYNHTEYVIWSTCMQVISYINHSPNFAKINRCSVERIREGIV